MVLNLVRRHVSNIAAVSSVDESGGEARTYGIDDNLVLKIQRPHRRRPRTSLEKEVFFLNQLRDYPEIRVPVVLGYGREENIEYIVMTRMPGVAALTVDLKGAKRREVLLQLGRVLRRLHSIAQSPFYSSSLIPGFHTREEFIADARASLAHAVQVIDDTPDLWPLGISPKDLAAKALAGLPATVELVALHTNPGPVHTFVQPDTLEFVGLSALLISAMRKSVLRPSTGVGPPTRTASPCFKDTVKKLRYPRNLWPYGALSWCLTICL